MKKKYNRPVSKVIVLDVQDLMAGSPNLSNQYSDTSIEALAKRNAFLEDDFEEE